ncbi:MAG: sugar phosphate nucleotidyltransferase [Candidatus Micrarchaeota archaeon]|nr:sugar phosphate nucleotidyltransferase [Candidatus Micrarchaeota archaeon]
MEKPKIVILCGGEGTRLREETEFKPKPMVTIGGMPILWHIMKIYSHYGFDDFVLCLGYKGEIIEQFFHNNPAINSKWNMTFVNTGLKAQTGTRVKRVEKYVNGDTFMLTYGDGLSNVNIKELFEFHLKKEKIGTLTGVQPHTRWGIVKADENGIITDFLEKPKIQDHINGGFYCFKKEFFDYLSEDEDCIMETKPLQILAKERQFAMFKHDGFWHGMDTYKDYLDLNKIWDDGNVPWKVWK